MQTINNAFSALRINLPRSIQLIKKKSETYLALLKRRKKNCTIKFYKNCKNILGVYTLNKRGNSSNIHTVRKEIALAKLITCHLCALCSLYWFKAEFKTGEFRSIIYMLNEDLKYNNSISSNCIMFSLPNSVSYELYIHLYSIKPLIN